MSKTITVAGSVIVSFITSIFGGWTDGLTVLLVMMGIDLITGIINALLSRSTKTETGALNSYVTWKGLIKKFITILVICMAYQLDKILGISVIRDACIIFFVFNEGTSILENCGQLGIPLPSIIVEALDLLKDKSKNKITK